MAWSIMFRGQTSATLIRHRLFRKGVEVNFVDANGGLKSVSLYLKDTEENLSSGVAIIRNF